MLMIDCRLAIHPRKLIKSKQQTQAALGLQPGCKLATRQPSVATGCNPGCNLKFLQPPSPARMVHGKIDVSILMLW